MAKDLIAAGTVENGQIMLNPAALSMMGGGQSVPQMQLPQMQQMQMSQQMPQMMMMQSAPQSSFNWRAAKGALLGVAGWFQSKTVASLSEEAEKANNELASARNELDAAAGYLKLAPTDTNRLMIVLDAQRKVNDKTLAALKAEQRVGSEQVRSNQYMGLSGAADLVTELVSPGGGGQQFPSMGGMPMMIQGPGGQPMQVLMVPHSGGGTSSLLTAGLAGMAGGVIANNLLPASSTVK